MNLRLIVNMVLSSAFLTETSAQLIDPNLTLNTRISPHSPGGTGGAKKSP